jgi:hypothetical protein
MLVTHRVMRWPERGPVTGHGLNTP